MRKFDALDVFGLGLVFALLVLMGYVIGIEATKGFLEIGSLSDVVVAFATLLLVFAAIRGIGEYQEHEHYRLAISFATDMYAFKPKMDTHFLRSKFLFFASDYIDIIVIKGQLIDNKLNESETSEYIEKIEEKYKKMAEYYAQFKDYTEHFRELHAMAVFVQGYVPIVQESVQILIDQLDDCEQALSLLTTRAKSMSFMTGLTHIDKLSSYEIQATLGVVNIDTLLGFKTKSVIDCVEHTTKHIDRELIRWLSRKL